MKRAAIAVAVVALIGAIWLVRRGNGAPPAPPAVDRPAVRVARPAPEARAAVTGRVTDGKGRGVAGAVVALVPAAEVDRAGHPIAREVETTDAAGAFTVKVPPGRYAASATAAGLRPAWRVVDVAPGARVELVLGDGGTPLRGHVTDAGGGPVAGARVVVMRRGPFSLHGPQAELVVVTGADGAFELALADGDYAIVARHDDYARSASMATIAGKPVTVDLVLAPGGTIRGRVVTVDGAPVPDARVLVSGGRNDGPEAPEAMTGDDGAFTLTGLGSGDIALSASAPALHSSHDTDVVLGLGEALDGVAIVVDEASYAIRGTVAHPCATRGEVVASGKSHAAAAIVADASDAACTTPFELVGLAPGEYDVTAALPGAMPASTTVTIVAADLTGVALAPHAGTTIAGRVEPPGIAAIRIVVPEDMKLSDPLVEQIGATRCESDDAGAFTLHDVPAGAWTVEAVAADGRTGSTDLAVPGRGDIAIRLSPRPTLAGKVVDPRGTPVGGARVTVMTAASPSMMVSSGSGLTADDGSFRIGNVVPGPAELVVTLDGQKLAWEPRTGEWAPRKVAIAPTTTEVTLVVETRDDTIRGIVRDAKGTGVAHAWVTPTRDGNTDGGDDSSHEYAAVLTDGDGKFAIAHLSRGTYTLAAESPGARARAVVEGIASTATGVAITLAPFPTLEVHATDGGAPLAEYELECSGRERAWRRSVRDPAGVVRLDRVVPGGWSCVVTAPAGTGEAELELHDGDNRLDIALSAWGSVAGSVVAPDGRPLAGARVELRGTSCFARVPSSRLSHLDTTTDAAGRFAIDRLPPCTGRLDIGTRSDTTAVRDVAIAPGARTETGPIATLAPRVGESGTLGLTAREDEGQLRIGVIIGDGAAEKAGLRGGERILAIDGTPVEELDLRLAALMLSSDHVAIGQRVRLTLRRNDDTFEIALVATGW